MKQLVAFFLLLVTFACSKRQSIKIKGSDTEVNLAVQLAEAFRYHNKDMLISVSGGGSGLGIASLLNGNTDIANSSREIKEGELQLFQQQNVKIDSFIFAQDAIAFIVQKDLQLDSISTKDLARVLSGEYENWSSLTTQNLPITIYGRQSNSGTHDFVKDKLEIDYAPSANQMNGNAQIIEGVKVDKTGIGYVGAGYVQANAKDYKILQVYELGERAISPLDAERIKNGEYIFQRPLYQFFKQEDYDNVKPFLEFEQTPEGQQIILQAGYYPAK